MSDTSTARALRVCVYCGSRTGARPVYAEAARRLARELAARGCDLVYGGASVGLMGVVADTMLAAGRSVTGVLPSALFQTEVAHAGLTRLVEVGSMHERKATMAELSDAFVALPGGFGTLEEIFEALTWTQIGLHAKPCGLLDVDGYFSHLASFLAHTVAEGFVAARNLDHLEIDDDPARLLDAMDGRRGAADLAVDWTRARGGSPS
ncbi:MAG: TIGR00730 family Rossman fold protein [Planctomycetes bacterium]|nr:TIGR00730 family Rossman fold protein [Planctomycetota bacterium]